MGLDRFERRLGNMDIGQPWMPQLLGTQPSAADLQMPPPGDMPGMPMNASGQITDMRANEAVARMQAQASSQMASPAAQSAYGPAFSAPPAGRGDPVSPTSSQRPMALNPGGAMPSTTPDMIETAMAPVGGSAGPGTEIYGETYPTAPTPPMPQQPSAARGVMDEMMLNRGDKAPWLALAAAGFGTAAGTSPHALTNIGQGGLKGIEMYDRMSDRSARDRLAAATALMRAEQDDRQAGFEQQKIGQGEQRIGIDRETLGIRRGEIQQRREEAAAKLADEERKREAERPERQSRADYYSAQADYTRYTKGQNPQAIMKEINASADREAKAEATDPNMGKVDGQKYAAILPAKKIAKYVDAGLPLPPDLRAYALSQAKAAIAKGASPEAVNQRLMRMGISVEE
jgi:hypothetical protein